MDYDVLLMSVNGWLKMEYKSKKQSKYYVSKYIIATLTASCAYGMLFIITALYFISKIGPQSIKGFWLACGIFLLTGVFFGGMFFIVEFVFLLIVDPFMGKYSLSNNGICFYTLCKTMYYSWNDFADVGTTRWVSDGSGKDYIYFIYFSKRPISDENRKWLVKYRSFKRPKKPNLPLYIKDYVCIQYSKNNFDDLLATVPEWIKEKLLAEEKRITLRGLERTFNK